MSQSSQQLLTANELVPEEYQYEVSKANKKVDLLTLPCPPEINDLRTMLHLPLASANRNAEFVEVPEFPIIVVFLNIIGHAVRIQLQGQFKTKDLP
ncbi:hypothetical protein Tco_1503300 [Tanacetum coccineum]